MSDFIPALSVTQPWAWLLIHGWKDIENRSWPTNYTGPLLIHAPKVMTHAEYDDVEWLLDNGEPGLSDLQIKLPPFKSLDRGGIVGICHMTGRVSQSESLWFNGPFGFKIENTRPLPFIPYLGKLGFFNVPKNLINP